MLFCGAFPARKSTGAAITPGASLAFLPVYQAPAYSFACEPEQPITTSPAEFTAMLGKK